MEYTVKSNKQTERVWACPECDQVNGDNGDSTQRCPKCHTPVGIY